MHVKLSSNQHVDETAILLVHYVQFSVCLAGSSYDTHSKDNDSKLNSTWLCLVLLQALLVAI